MERSPETFIGINLLYEMATGRKPFAVEYEQALLYAILNEDPTPVAELNSDLPKPMADVIDACLHKDADKRPTMEAVRDVMGDESSATKIVSTIVEPKASQRAMQGSLNAIGKPLQYVIASVVVVVLIIALITGVEDIWLSNRPPKSHLLAKRKR